jgi:hypothetical protein
MMMQSQLVPEARMVCPPAGLTLDAVVMMVRVEGSRLKPPAGIAAASLMSLTLEQAYPCRAHLHGI